MKWSDPVYQSRNLKMDIIRHLIQISNPTYTLEDLLGEALYYSPFKEIPVDVLDTNWEDSHGSWDQAYIYNITQPNVDDRKYTIRIRFPYWSSEYDVTLTLWDSDILEDDDRDQIAKPKTKAFYGWQHPFEAPCVVSYYVSDGLKKNRGWVTASIIDIESQSSITLAYQSNKTLKVKVAPWGSRNVHSWCPKEQFLLGAKHYYYFKRLERQIYEDMKHQRRENNRKNAKKRRLKQKRLQDIKRQKKVILNEETLYHLKQKPMCVNQRCLAYQEGWVNKYGIPRAWAHCSQTKFMEDNTSTSISSFLDKKSLLNYGTVCKYMRQLIFNPKTLQYLLKVFTANEKTMQKRFNLHFGTLHQIECSSEWTDAKKGLQSAVSYRWSLNDTNYIHWKKLSEAYKTLQSFQHVSEKAVSALNDCRKSITLQKELCQWIMKLK